jgi:predicted nucleic acid-binding protein
VTRNSPKPVVVDASALLLRLLGGRRGAATAQAVGDAPMVAPHHLDVEVLNALRGLDRSRQIGRDRAAQVVEDLLVAPIERIDTTRLGPLIWNRRENLSAYDAAYSALAEVLGYTLVTADQRLARALAGPVSVVIV